MEIVVQQTLPKPVESFLNVLAGRAEQFGEKFGAVFKKLEMAEGTGKDVKTITSYLKQLEEANLIEMSTKRGKHGGVTILFNDKILKFEQKETPFFAETKTLKELEEYFYPQFKRPEPKRKYRPKSEILVEKAFKSKARAEQDRLNAILADSDYPTREFFLQTEDPLLYTRAYLASRMYNAYTVIYPEIRKNQLEPKGEWALFQKKSFQTVQYSTYDCLSKEFIGTSTFTCFIKLVQLIESIGATPLSYLTTMFDRTQFIDDKSNGKATLPFINASYGDNMLNYYMAQRKFRHDYYTSIHNHKIETKDNYMPQTGAEYPIIQLLAAVYEDPSAYRTPFDNVLDTVDPLDMMLTASNKERTLYGYYNMVTNKIAESDLTDSEKAVLTSYMKQQTATFLGRQGLVPAQYLATHVSSLLQVRKDFEESGETNLRKLYAKLGNTSNLTEYTKPEQAGFVKKGYQLDFSIRGNQSFYATLKTIQSFRMFNLDSELLMSAWENFGKANIPILKNGMLDVEQIYANLLTPGQLEADRGNFDFNSMNDIIPIDGQTGLWYDIVESNIGDSPRDGRWTRG